MKFDFEHINRLSGKYGSPIYIFDEKAFIDNYYELCINKFNRGYYFPTTDGTHHNVLGAKLMAEHIASKLF